MPHSIEWETKTRTFQHAASTFVHNSIIIANILNMHEEIILKIMSFSAFKIFYIELVLILVNVSDF